MRTQRGLTLIELVIALLILAIVFGIAAPMVSGALAASRSASARADLLDSLASAAVRAGISGTRAVLCPSPDGEECSDEVDWSGGWLVFMDPNANRELDPGERLLRRQPPLGPGVRLHSTTGRVRIVYQGNAGSAGSNVTFTLCDGRGATRAVALVMANNGRLRDGVPAPEAAAAACSP